MKSVQLRCVFVGGEDPYRGIENIPYFSRLMSLFPVRIDMGSYPTQPAGYNGPKCVSSQFHVTKPQPVFVSLGCHHPTETCCSVGIRIGAVSTAVVMNRSPFRVSFKAWLTN